MRFLAVILHGPLAEAFDTLPAEGHGQGDALRFLQELLGEDESTAVLRYNKFMDGKFRLQYIRDKLRDFLPILETRFGVDSLYLFGSFVRAEEKEGSDLDILVTFSETPGLFRYIECENFLSDSLGIKVDLVMKDALKPEIGRRILSEAVPV